MKFVPPWLRLSEFSKHTAHHYKMTASSPGPPSASLATVWQQLFQRRGNMFGRLSFLVCCQSKSSLADPLHPTAQNHLCCISTQLWPGLKTSAEGADAQVAADLQLTKAAIVSMFQNCMHHDILQTCEHQWLIAQTWAAPLGACSCSLAAPALDYSRKGMTLSLSRLWLPLNVLKRTLD